MYIHIYTCIIILYSYIYISGNKIVNTYKRAVYNEM